MAVAAIIAYSQLGNQALVMRNQGDANANLEQYEEAIADYDQALRVQPDNMLAYIHRGLAKARMGDFEEAIIDFNQALELEPDNESAYINRGLAKYNLGRSQEAIADYDQALNLQPDSVLAYYNRGAGKGLILAGSRKRSSTSIRRCSCSPTTPSP